MCPIGQDVMAEPFAMEVMGIYEYPEMKLSLKGYSCTLTIHCCTLTVASRIKRYTDMQND